MDLVPPGITTMETAARHLRTGARRLHDAAARTHLTDIKPVPLGRSLGTYRLIPQVSVPLLRQALSPAPRRLAAWQDAVDDVLASDAWTRALASVARRPSREHGAGGGAAVDALLRSPSFYDTMEDLHHESTHALARHGLDDLIQIQGFVVDRLEDDEDAVILLGPAQRSYLLPRFLLRVAGLEREKVWGILVATRTGTGIDLDVWPPVEDDESGAWRPDEALLSLRTEVGAVGA